MSLLIYDYRITDKYFYFYGVKPFSNMTKCKLKYKDMSFNSVEQGYMYYKSIYFNDSTCANNVLSFDNPHDTKKHCFKNLDMSDLDNLSNWNLSKLEIMTDLVRSKFNQNEDLLEILLNTGDLILVESSPTDIVWGIGRSVLDIDANVDIPWRGSNWLGKILTNVKRDFYESNN